MSYPGDTSLTADTQERIQSTFAQTRDLADQGSVQEALLGCDFILRLDPQFEPARQLQAELKGDASPIETRDPVGDGQPAEEAETSSDAGDQEDDTDGQSLAEGVEPDLSTEEAEAEALPEEESDVEATEDAVEVAADGEMLDTDNAQDQAQDDDAGDDGSRAEAETDAFVEGMMGAFQVPGEDGEATHHEGDDADEESATAPGVKAEEGAAEETLESATNDFGETDEGSWEPEEGALDSDEQPGAEHDSQRRISQLLAEGQEAFARSEYQEAIDAWSRVFLIDIDHQEASERIEEARKFKAESERELEELFHEGVGHFELGEFDAARATFDRVLESHPNHLSAQEYLGRISRRENADSLGAVEAVEESESDEDLPLDLPEDASPLGDIPQDVDIPELSVLDDVVASAEGDVDRPIVPARGAAVRSGGLDASKKFLVIGTAVLAAFLVGGWFLWENRLLFFPQSGGDSSTRITAESIDPIERARRLHDRGKTAIAVAQLRRIPQDSVSYAEAQALIAQWESEGSPDAELAAELPSPEDLEQQAALIAGARVAYRNREFLRATDLFRDAAGIAPLAGTISALREDAEMQIQSIRQEITLFRQGEWELVLPTLWSTREIDPDNRDIQRLIVDSYYNLGVRDLQRGHPAAAAGKFSEALTLEPADADLQRLYVFAQTYESRGQDLLYRIFVKYLPFR